MRENDVFPRLSDAYVDNNVCYTTSEKDTCIRNSGDEEASRRKKNAIRINLLVANVKKPHLQTFL